MHRARNQAILLDSDSDGIDSDDEHASVCSSDSDSSADGVVGTADSFTQSTRVTPRPTGEITASPPKRLQKQASSRKARRAGLGREGAQQQAEGQGDDGLIKASYPTTPESQATVAAAAATVAQGPGAAGAMGVSALRGVSRRALPLALLYQQGAILSDSDSDGEEAPAAQASRSGLLPAQRFDSAAAAPAAAPAPAPAATAAPAPVLGPAAAKPAVLLTPPSRGKAAAVRQAVAGAAQAAGRAMAAAQAGAGAATRQQGVEIVVPTERASSPIVLTTPKRAAFTAAAGLGGSPRSAAAVPQARAAAAAKASDRPVPQWEPSFPGPEGEEQQQQQGASWAEGGWSNVAL